MDIYYLYLCVVVRHGVEMLRLHGLLFYYIYYHYYRIWFGVKKWICARLVMCVRRFREKAGCAFLYFDIIAAHSMVLRWRLGLACCCWHIGNFNSHIHDKQPIEGNAMLNERQIVTHPFSHCAQIEFFIYDSFFFVIIAMIRCGRLKYVFSIVLAIFLQRIRVETALWEGDRSNRSYLT